MAFTATKIKVEQVITERIMEALRNGTIPWRKPWGTAGLPVNLITNREYRGVNVFMLSMAGYDDPRFLTYLQAKEKGGHVRKGERSLPVLKYGEGTSKRDFDAEGNPKTYRFFLYSNVFNVSQVDGLELPSLPDVPVHTHTPIERCESVVKNMPNCPPIAWNSNRASYSPSADAVSMPPRERFTKTEEMYATLFHELAHSTGHKSRLNRDNFAGDLGSGSYAREELVAEMGAAFLCGHCGIETETVENAAAYIAGWLKRLSDDPKLVIQAGSKANAASDYILGKSGKTAENESELVAESAVA